MNLNKFFYQTYYQYYNVLLLTYCNIGNIVVSEVEFYHNEKPIKIASVNHVGQSGSTVNNIIDGDDEKGWFINGRSDEKVGVEFVLEEALAGGPGTEISIVIRLRYL